jgi:hypothetical protein
MVATHSCKYAGQPLLTVDLKVVALTACSSASTSSLACNALTNHVAAVSVQPAGLSWLDGVTLLLKALSAGALVALYSRASHASVLYLITPTQTESNS